MADGAWALTAECHLLPAASPGRFMAYFPLKSLLMEVDAGAAEVLAALARGPLPTPGQPERATLEVLVGVGVVNGPPDRVPEPSHPETPLPRAVTLLPSNRCTLACRYCYAPSALSGALMSMEVARAAIDLVIAGSCAARSRLAGLTFHGGGEPTQNWGVLTGAHAYAQAQARAHRILLRSSICTNGMVSDEQAEWIAASIGSITVSVDGPPEAHNLERPTAGGGPSFDHVARTLDVFRSRGRAYDLRMTLSSAYGARLPELYTFLADRFSPARISAEPLYPGARALAVGVQPPEAGTLVSALEETLEAAASRGIPFTYAGGRISRLDTCFCGADGRSFIVTPTGRASACLEVTADDDPRAAVFFYGEYRPQEKRFVFDSERYRRLCAIRGPSRCECSGCFARWHCAGDCPAKSPDAAQLAERRNPYRCTLNRAVLRKQLELCLRGIGELPSFDRLRPEEVSPT